MPKCASDTQSYWGSCRAGGVLACMPTHLHLWVGLSRFQRLIDDNELLKSVHELDIDEPDPPPLADPVADAVRNGYDKTVRPFHSWLMRKSFDLISSQARIHPHSCPGVSYGPATPCSSTLTCCHQQPEV